MSNSINCSAPSTSKQNDSGEQSVYDVESYVKNQLTKSGIKSVSTNEDKFVCFVILFKLLNTNRTKLN